MEPPPQGVVLDAGPVIAFLLDELGADAVASRLSSRNARMSTVNAAEVVDVLVRVRGGEPGRVTGLIDELLSSLVAPVPASLKLATRAGELRARHFRRDRRLSLADCFVLATAGDGHTILTNDGHLAAAAHDEGVDVELLNARST